MAGEVIDARELLGKKENAQDETAALTPYKNVPESETIPPAGETNGEPSKDQAPTPPAPDSEQEAPAAAKPAHEKTIIITLKAGIVNAECKGVCPAEVWGMLHEAERLIKRQIEINEAMAFQQEMEKQALMAQLRAPKPKIQ